MSKKNKQSQNQTPKKNKKRSILTGFAIGLGSLALAASAAGITHFVMTRTGGDEKTDKVKINFILGPHGLSFTGPTTIEAKKGSKFSEIARPTPIADTDYEFDSWSIGEDEIINADTTVTASFKESSPMSDKEFTVMFAIADPTNGVISGQTTTKVYGNQTFKSINKPYVQANKGFRFKGWDIDENTKITANSFVYAEFEPYTPVYQQEITITFNAGANGNFTGYIPTTLKVEAGTSFREINKPNVIPDAGYYFDGWATESGDPITESTIFAGNVKIVAQYTTTKPGENTHMILFDAGLHGAFASGESMVSVYENTPFGNVNKPAVSAFVGYTFVGWSISEKTPITSSCVATAQYIVNPINPIPAELQVKINFVAAEHGSLSETTQQIVQSGTKFGQLNLPYAIPENGYMFNGWYVDTDKISDDTEICSDITLTAKFVAVPSPEPTKYTITFDKGVAGEIDPEYATVSAYENQTLADINHPKVTPNDGYTFIGWDTPKTTVITGPMTVTALYIKTPDVGDYIKLTFDAGQNGFINGQTTTYCAKSTIFGSINCPAVIAKPGYRFTGWSISSSTVLSENTTIVAQYETDEKAANKLVVTYDAGLYGYFEDGVTKWYELVDKDTKVSMLLKPTVYAYSSKRFNGWDRKDNETITADTTITANYKDRDPKAVLCLVTFAAGDHGSLSGPLYQVVESGTLVENVSKPVAYADSNYEFTGWDKDSTEEITGDTVLTAQYQEHSSKEYKIELIQPEAETNWTLTASTTQAKYNDDVTITVKKVQGQTTDKVPYSISINADGEIKTIDLTKVSDDEYNTTFKMKYSCDIRISLNFKTSHPIDKIYSTIEGKDYVYKIDNLCSWDKIVLTNFEDDSDTKEIDRASFNEQLNFPAAFADLNKSNFLIGCTSYNKPIDLSNCSEIKSIPAAFLAGCTNFNSEIKLPDVATIGEKFLQGCKNFNQAIDVSTVQYFGEDFMFGCETFNQPLNIDSAVVIYDSFMYNCKSFNQNLTIPDSVRHIVDNFMFNCDSMTSTITFLCAESSVDPANHSLTSLNPEAACYKQGIKIDGGIAEYIVSTAMPELSGTIYRHLVKA